jgi:hypothetical protein
LKLHFPASATVCCLDGRVGIPELIGFSLPLAIMPSLARVVFVRSGCAFILGCISSLVGLVAWTTWTAQFEYPRSPSSIIWAAVGATFGFLVGACIGNRRLAGRGASLIAGLVAGVLLGALIGWDWAHTEYAFARRQLLEAGLSAQFIDACQGGFSVACYEAIGLQYGICLGILGGTTAGWFWNQPRLNLVAKLFPVTISCFVAIGAITMQTGMRDLSKHALEQGWQSWRDWQMRTAVTSRR